jgi:hypothetical protein
VLTKDLEDVDSESPTNHRRAHQKWGRRGRNINRKKWKWGRFSFEILFFYQDLFGFSHMRTERGSGWSEKVDFFWKIEPSRLFRIHANVSATESNRMELSNRPPSFENVKIFLFPVR